MKIGYFEHWSRPHWNFTEFLEEEGYDIEKIDFSNKNYLEKYDVVLVEQNGFNDYIENDELYIQDWVSRGGIFLFMHQDYMRWAPCFLPEHLNNTKLIHRYIPTIGGASFANFKDSSFMIYMQPWAVGQGKNLFHYPEKIEPDEMIGWDIKVNSFTIIRGKPDEDISERVHTAALSCYLADENWEVLGTYMDPGVRDGALILQGRHGKGLYFLNQILVPEVKLDSNKKCLDFWRKYMKNLMHYFANHKAGVTDPIPEKGSLPAGKRNYKLCIHMHSLDWYGCDSAPGTINALMRQMGYDICSLAIKDAACYKGKLDPEEYSDDKVLFLDGQEYHPFNWKDKLDSMTHNGYHLLAVGTDHDAYTPEFTKSIYGDEEVDAYLKKALKYIKDHNGAAVATHPQMQTYWFDYPVDAVDIEPLRPLTGTPMETYWLKGGKVTMMNSVDLFGTRRMYQNPAVNFIYLADGATPNRDSVVAAIKAGHNIAACGFTEADITCNGAIPGDTIAKQDAMQIHVTAAIFDENIQEVRIYADEKLILAAKEDAARLDKDYTVNVPADAKHFLRVEISGSTEERSGTHSRIAATTPFYFQ
ncbi:MAG: hypothetical protein IKB16_10625 [Lentisphaeria bacterium]|nr:hypothetical protein [Lentisphaeria bacterium]